MSHAHVRQISNLGPLAQLRTGRLVRRIPQLLAGLVLFGVSIALMVRAQLGLAPWDVLHSGLTRWLPLTIGQVIVLASFACCCCGCRWGSVRVSARWPTRW